MVPSHARDGHVMAMFHRRNGAASERAGQSGGPATDASGTAVVDPTDNVTRLVEASIQRLDDLREREAAYAQAIAEQRVQRQDDLRQSEALHLRELADVRAQFEDRLAKAESNRIDAIRAVDVAATQQTAAVQAAAATTLATQANTLADALRTQVATTATASQVALAAALEPIQKDIADLRRAQYEALGQKTNVIERQASGQNAGLWIGLAVSGFIALISIAGLLIAVFAGGTSP